MGACTMGPEEVGTSPDQGRYIKFSESPEQDDTRAMAGHPIENVTGQVNKAMIPVGGKFSIVSWVHDGDTNAMTGPGEFLNHTVTRMPDQNNTAIYKYTLEEGKDVPARWPSDNSKLSFAAVYPHEDVVNDDPVFATTGHLELVDTGKSVKMAIAKWWYMTPENSDGMIDYMAANGRNSMNYDDTTDGYKTLIFTHSLARVTFSAKLDGFASSDKVVITKIEMNGVERSGIHSIAPLSSTNAWQVDPKYPAPSDRVYIVDSQLVKRVLKNDVAQSLAYRTATNHSDLMLIPWQYKQGAHVKIEVEVNGAFYKNYEVSLALVPNLVANTVNNYVLTVAPDRTEIDAIVTPWVDKDVDFISDGDDYIQTEHLEKFNSWAYAGATKSSEGEELVEQTIAVETSSTSWEVHKPVGVTWPAWIHSVEKAGDSKSYTVRVYPNHGQNATGERVFVNAFTIVAGNLRRSVTIEQAQGGMLAPPGILGVGAQSGRLTMRGSKEFARSADAEVRMATEFGGLADETVYVGLFKRGSAVARNSVRNGLPFTNADIAWAPSEFNRTSVGDNWMDMPFVDNSVSTYPNDLSRGLGDPCTLADKGTATLIYQQPLDYNPNNWADFVQALPREASALKYYTAAATANNVMGLFKTPSTFFFPYDSGFVYVDNANGDSDGTLTRIGEYPHQEKLATLLSHDPSSSSMVWYSDNGSVLGSATGLVTYEGMAAPVRCITASAPEPMEPYILYLTPYGHLAAGQWRGNDQGENPKIDPDARVTANNILYVKFGSTVGSSGKPDDFVKNWDVWDASKATFNPTFQDYSIWSSIPYPSTEFQVGDNIGGDSFNTPDNLVNGKGDICRLVGLTAQQVRDLYNKGQLGSYESGFRMPTPQQNLDFLGAYTVGAHWIEGYVNGWFERGGMFPNTATGSMKTYLPATDYRSDDGNFWGSVESAYYWSNEKSSMSYHRAHVLHFTEDNVNSGSFTERAGDLGNAVRCVRKQ